MTIRTVSRSLDRATREIEYSPSSAIGGNYAPFVAEYSSRSAQALVTMMVRRDLRYGAAPRAMLDYFPAEPASHPAGLLVYIHGGYWQELSKNESAFLAPAWHAAGFAHAVVGYTLAPQATLPTIVTECRTALRWLIANATSLGFDPSNIVVAGSSAGGYLAAACAARHHPGDAAPRGIVPVSGVFDVAPLIGTSINDALGLDQPTADSLNLLDETREFCPAVVAWGEIEPNAFKEQSRAFAGVIRDAGHACTEHEIAGRNHFDVILELADPRSDLFAASRRLFRDSP